MKRLSYKPYVALLVTLFTLFSLPFSLVEKTRMKVATWLSFLYPPPPPSAGTTLQDLQTRCFQLQQQIAFLEQELLNKKIIEETLSLVSAEKSLTPFLQRRELEWRTLMTLRTLSLNGEVTYRDPSPFSTTFWINLGEKNNERLGYTVISTNSPVVIGSTLLGIIDFVGKERSRVRLITDSSVAPSVRAIRPSPNGSYLYLAKGELSGAIHPNLLSKKTTLRGIGFNYDFPDKEGLANPKTALLLKGDKLITTGFDGLFPGGLFIGVVSTVLPSHRGESLFDLEVEMDISNLHKIRFVTVLPPLDRGS